MFQRKVNYVKIFAKQNHMSVKEYKAYMQGRIENMKTDPETSDWFYDMSVSYTHLTLPTKA